MPGTNRTQLERQSDSTLATQPRVSVVMITYMHEEFIAQAIDGVLSQRTQFPFELIISDDASPDRTRDVIQEYANNHAEVIRLNYPQQNLGAIKNFATQINAARGEYIAFCEGDDWWTDPNKLQLQVDFLDRNLDCALCHHSVSYYDNDSGVVIRQFPPKEFRENLLSGDRLTQQNFIQTCALMVRRKAVPHLPETFGELKLGDWPLCVLAARKGLIGYLNRDMSTFRIHHGGTWSTRSEQSRIDAVSDMGRFLLTQLNAADRTPWTIFTLNCLAVAVQRAAQQRRYWLVVRDSLRLLAVCLRYYPKAIPYNVFRVVNAMLSHRK